MMTNYGTAMPQQVIVDWLIACWKAAQWNTYCECTPGLGTGTCPSVDAKYWTGTITNTEVLAFSFPLLSGTWDRIKIHTFIDTIPGASSMNLNWKTYNSGIFLAQYLFSSESTTGSDLTGTYTGISYFTTKPDEIRLYVRRWGGALSYTVNVHGYPQYDKVSGAFTCDAVSVPGTPYTPPAIDPPPAGLPEPPALPTGCTTDDLCKKLQQALAMLSITATEVDDAYLWTRSPTIPPPNLYPSYRTGTTHTGLTGRGDFAVGVIRGLKVSVTAWPSYTGSVVGDPTTYYRFGWIHTGNLDGWIDHHAIRHTAELVLPVDGRASKIGYSLPAGVTINITELVPF